MARTTTVAIAALAAVGVAYAVRRQRIADRDQHLTAGGGLTGSGRGSDGPKVPVEFCDRIEDPISKYSCKVGGSLFNFITSLPARHSLGGKLMFYYDRVNRELNGACIATTGLAQYSHGGVHVATPLMGQRHLRANGDSDWDPSRSDQVCIMYANLCVPMRGCRSGRANWGRCAFGTRSLHSYRQSSGGTGSPTLRDWAPTLPHMAEAKTDPPFRHADTGTRTAACPQTHKRFFESWGKTARAWADLTGTSL